MTATITDIARIAGVSEATVSRALTGDARISEQTRKKVEKIAKELNYRRNDIAKSFRLQKTQTLGLIIPDVLNLFYLQVTRGVEDQAQKMGYNLMLCNSDYDPVKERKYIDVLVGRKVDGILVFPVVGKGNNLEFLRDSGVPFVLMDTCPQGVEANYLFTDHEAGAFGAVNYLIRGGHRRIALYIGRRGMTSSGVQMETGYHKALSRAGIGVDARFIVSTALKEEDNLKHATRKLLQKQRDLGYTAVLCISDVFAKSIYDVSRQLGLRVPEDVSVIGYDDTFICNYFTPPLTSVSQPKYSLGQQAVDLLLRHLVPGEAGRHETIKLRPRLVERGSVASLPGSARDVSGRS
ncbi:MAG: LacI family DNA-binding transcriptional regulator [Patescibacteria group bacterium]